MGDYTEHLISMAGGDGDELDLHAIQARDKEGGAMRACQHCGKAVVWNSYWTTWDHERRNGTLEAELCFPASGFHGSTYATPAASA